MLTKAAQEKLEQAQFALNLPYYFYDFDAAEVLLRKKVGDVFGSDSADTALVLQAFELGKEAHKNQAPRKSGHPFYLHPTRVALSVLDYCTDVGTVLGALLHDLFEDTLYPSEKISEVFGEEVFTLVEGLTKVKTKDKSDFRATMQRIFTAGRQDFRVMVIKLLDRLDNVRDLALMPAAKQRKKTVETLTVYCRVARDLGLNELEELLLECSFYFRYPQSYNLCRATIDRVYIQRQKYAEELDLLNSALPAQRVYSVKPKLISVYDFYVKRRQNILFVLEEITIITESVADCYSVLGCLHTKFRALVMSFRDFISNPRKDGYTGLCTTIFLRGVQHRISILTHEHAEKNKKGVITLFQEGNYTPEGHQDLFDSYLVITEGKEHNEEFSSRVQDVFHHKRLRHGRPEYIQVYDTDGGCYGLYAGATVIDLAYEIDVELGNYCRGAMISPEGSTQPVFHARSRELQNGDSVKVLCAPKIQVRERWLACAIMPKSINSIQKYVRDAQERANYTK